MSHESLGTDCRGCLFVLVNGDQAGIICNECGARIRLAVSRDPQRQPHFIRGSSGRPVDGCYLIR